MPCWSGWPCKSNSTVVEGRIADVRDRERVFRLIAEFKPNLVFHAAALKHVPLLERDWDEGIKTNVFGSVNVADAALHAGADAMVMISTDKAIDPVSVLGATKRLAEMYCQAWTPAMAAHGQWRQAADAHDRRALRQCARFERLGGAEIQVADRSWRSGHGDASGHGALLHDHPRSLRPRRYGGEPRARPDALDTSVYVLNMGQPIKIVDLAERMIRLSGLEPGRDVDIVFTGIRPGERLNEILFASEEGSSDIGIDGVVAAKPVCPPIAVVQGWIEKLQHDLETGERVAIYGVLREAVPNFGGGLQSPTKQ